MIHLRSETDRKSEDKCSDHAVISSLEGEGRSQPRDTNGQQCACRCQKQNGETYNREVLIEPCCRVVRGLKDDSLWGGFLMTAPPEEHCGTKESDPKHTAQRDGYTFHYFLEQDRDDAHYGGRAGLGEGG